MHARSTLPALHAYAPVYLRDCVFTVLARSFAYIFTSLACFFVLCFYVLTCLTSLLCSMSSQLTFTCSKATIETLENLWNMFTVNNKKARTYRPWLRSGAFIVTFRYIPHLFLVVLLLILNKYLLAGSRGYVLVCLVSSFVFFFTLHLKS